MQLTGYADKDLILPVYGTNGLPYPRPGNKLVDFQRIVFHGTGNRTAGANALMHYRWLMNSRPPASFHFCADSQACYQFLPIDEVGWHAGDGASDPRRPSFHTVAVEICDNSDGDFSLAARNACRAMANVLVAYGKQPVDVQTVVPHRYYAVPHDGWPAFTTHSLCPAGAPATGTGYNGMSWAKLIGMLHEEYTTLANTEVVNGITLSGRLLDAWVYFRNLGNQRELRFLGLPFRPIYDATNKAGNVVHVLECERSTLIHDPAADAPWDLAVKHHDEVLTPIATRLATVPEHVVRLQPRDDAIIASIDEAHQGHGR